MLVAELLDEPTDAELDKAALEGEVRIAHNLRTVGYESSVRNQDILKRKRRSTVVGNALRELRIHPFTSESVERYKSSMASQKPSTAFLIIIGVLGFLAMGLFMNLSMTSLSTEWFGAIAFWPVTVINIVVGIILAGIIISERDGIFNKTGVIKYDHGLPNSCLLLLASPFLGIYYMCWIFSGEKSWRRVPLNRCAGESLELPEAAELLINRLVDQIGPGEIGRKNVVFSVDTLQHESYQQLWRRLDPFLVVSCQEEGVTHEYYVCVWKEESYHAHVETM